MKEPTINNTITPYHYQGTIQPIDLINAQDLNFNLGNVVKYVCRAGKKKGENILTDLEKAKDYIEANLDFEAYIYESKVTLMDFARYIASSSLFVSTSTGPMHLAGASNSQTLSFFGDSLFASSKRWATVSDEKYQNNFMINKNYTKEQYLQIENRLKEILDVK